MKDQNDLLSADSSPSSLNKTGVKRANNVPVFIIIGIVMIFVLLIAMVAVKRAHKQTNATQIIEKYQSKNDPYLMAKEVIDKHSSYVEMPKAVSSVTEMLPLHAETIAGSDKAQVVDAPMDEREIERDRQEQEHIRQEKQQQFEEALKAKTSVSFSLRGNQTLQSHSNQTNGFNNAMDPNMLESEQMRLLPPGFGQEKKVTTQSLGGEENESRWQLKSTLQAPTSLYEISTGSVIPGVMISGIRSELPGQIIGQVSQNVYDSATGRHLLIPQGTKIIGIYSNDVGFGQDSVMIAWQRLQFPDNTKLDIGAMPGADSAGYAGFRDEVNHHYVRIYGSALLMSAIVAGVSYSQNLKQTNATNNPPSFGNVMSQSLGQELGQVTAKLVEKNLNISPTVTIRPGYRFNITVVKDLVFNHPYRAFAY